MRGIALNQNEKKACPSLHLHNSAETLNRFVIQNHRNLIRQEVKQIKEDKKIKETKNKNLLEGLGISGKKEVKVEVEHKIVESRGATVLNVKRVIKFMEAGRSYTKSDLAADLMMPTTVIEEILNFLHTYTTIKIDNEGSHYIRRN
jgi:hypothetical protein